MPTGAPARHRAGQRPIQNHTRGSARRVRYLLCDLLALLVLTAGGLYLAHGFGSAPPPASGKVTALQTSATCASAPAASLPAVSAPAVSAPAVSAPAVSAAGSSAAGGSCAGRPYHAAVTMVPPAASANLSSAPAKRPARPTPTASASASPATPSPASSATDSPDALPGELSS